MFPAATRSALLAAVFLLGLAGAWAASAARKPPVRPATSIWLGGTEYIDLATFCARYGLKPEKPSARRAVYKSNWTTLDFEIDSRDHLINGVRVYTGDPVRSHRGRVWLSQIDADALITPILRPGTNQARIPGLKKIVIDPGHGGRDPGKVNTRVSILEKNAALDTARRAQVLLEKQGYDVVLTRSDDRYLDLSDRAEITQRAGGDFFISIHFNSVEVGADQVTGVEVFSLTPHHQFSTSDAAREDAAEAKRTNPGNRFDHWNAAASYGMHRAMIETLRVTDRGLKRARWKVLVLAPCPATYVEAGYLSNHGEARKIATPAYRQKIAEAIAHGVRDYAAVLTAARKRA
jgi:N-acetylmuramoyl-L-alanine amidase